MDLFKDTTTEALHQARKRSIKIFEDLLDRDMPFAAMQTKKVIDQIDAELAARATGEASK